MSFDQLNAFATQNPVLGLIFAGLTLALIYTEIARRFSGFAHIGVARTTELVNREDALLIDVSPATDFEKGHIVGSQSIPMAQFNPKTHKSLAQSQERKIILVCRAGVTADSAAKQLVKAGFKHVHVLDGGIQSWRQADLPLRSGK